MFTYFLIEIFEIKKITSNLRFLACLGPSYNFEHKISQLRHSHSSQGLHVNSTTPLHCGMHGASQNHLSIPKQCVYFINSH